MPTNFLTFLIEELARRQALNQNYSLRAFARDLTIEPSQLSKLLKGKISLTESMLNRLLQVLIFTDEEKNFYIKELTNKEQYFTTVKLNDEDFALLQDWYHTTLIQISELDGFDSTPEWISKKMGITIKQAEVSIERLLKFGLMKKSSTGKLTTSIFPNTGIKLVSDNPDAHFNAIQCRTVEIAKKHLEALQNKPKDKKRIHRNVSIAIDSSLIEEAREEIKQFTYELATRLEKKSKKKDQIYEIVASLIPMTIEF